MTKQKRTKQSKEYQDAIKKQQLNAARNAYLHFRKLNSLTDMIYKRFDLYPVFEDIEV